MTRHGFAVSLPLFLQWWTAVWNQKLRRNTAVSLPSTVDSSVELKLTKKSANSSWYQTDVGNSAIFLQS
jgi:hypothetical protein